MRHETTRPDGASNLKVKICALSREGALQQTILFKERHNPMSFLMPVTRLRLLRSGSAMFAVRLLLALCCHVVRPAHRQRNLGSGADVCFLCSYDMQQWPGSSFLCDIHAR